MPPRKANRRAQAERELREKAELDVLMLQRELDRRAEQRPPLYRADIVQWDWRCRCGNVVWSGRRFCPMCNATRSQGGYTITGSAKGSFQSTPAVLMARENQRQVPGYGFQIASASKRGRSDRLLVDQTKKGVGGNTVPQQRPTSFLEAAQTATVAASNSTPMVVHDAAAPATLAPLTKEAVEQLNDDLQPVDEDQGLDPTIPEDLDYDGVRRSLVKCERVLERRSKRHLNELASVEAKQQMIVTHQAELAVLQATADATLAEMQVCKDTIAELSDRQAAMAAERAKAAGLTGPTASAPAPLEASDGIRYAQKCVSDIVFGVHNFANELPEVQALLQQLVAAIDAARVSRQTEAPQHFHIATGSVTPAEAEQPPIAMAVVGQCLGDKRKRDDLDPSPA